MFKSSLRAEQSAAWQSTSYNNMASASARNGENPLLSEKALTTIWIASLPLQSLAMTIKILSLRAERSEAWQSASYNNMASASARNGKNPIVIC